MKGGGVHLQNLDNVSFFKMTARHVPSSLHPHLYDPSQFTKQSVVGYINMSGGSKNKCTNKNNKTKDKTKQKHTEQTTKQRQKQKQKM
jgi:hypothetical protein